jgi:DNA processing protein
LNTLHALLALSSNSGFNQTQIRKLLKDIPCPIELCKILKVEFGKNDENELNQASLHDTHIVSFLCEGYPKELLSIKDFPLILYMKGALLKEINSLNKTAVVGTRNCTLYGLEMARKISSDLARNHHAVVSGLARGIDTSAHKGALESGYTIAVIGSGIANIYPKENIYLASEIANNGILISEFPMQSPPLKANFPKRNRIVSALSGKVVLIEAPIKSGAMITMNIAMDQGKELFALPGRADCPNFEGNLEWIQKGKAKLIKNAFEILNIENIKESSAKAIPQLTNDESVILNLFSNGELFIDEVCKKTSMPISKINVVLMSLMLKKVITEYPGKIYKLCEYRDG